MNELPIAGSSGLPAVADKRPAFGYTPRTQDYWYSKIVDSINRLEISERAQKANERKKKYQQYDFQQDRGGKPIQTVNGISRQLVTFVHNVVTTNPTVTPQFYQEHEELMWRYKLKGFVENNIRTNDLKTVLADLVWDTFFADIAWLKADWRTQFVGGTPTDPADSRQRQMQESAKIDQEHAAMGTGMALPTEPDDWHELHIDEHSKQEDALNQTIDTFTQAQAAGFDTEPQIAQAQQTLTLVGLHKDEHIKAARTVDQEFFEARRWPSYLVYYDPDAPTWKDAGWYALEVVERREVMMERDDLRGVSKLKGQPGRVTDEYHEGPANRARSSQPSADITGPTETYIRHFIIHDREGSQLIIIAVTETSQQVPLLVTDWPFEGDIVCPLVLRPVNDRIHGIPLIHILEFVHTQYAAVQDKISEYITKIPAAKMFIEKELLTDEVKKIISDPSKFFCPVKSLPKEKLMPWVAPGIDQNLLEERQRLNNELQLESGIPEVYNAGESDETATATAVRDRQAGNKIDDAKNKVASLVEWYCTTLVDTFRLHGTTEQWVRVIGDQGLQFDKFLPSDIPRDVYWNVDSDSLAPSKREMEKKQVIELLNVLTPLAGLLPGFQDFVISAVGKWDIMENPQKLKEQPPMPPMMPGMMPGGGAPGQVAPMQQQGMPGQMVGGELAAGATI